MPQIQAETSAKGSAWLLGVTGRDPAVKRAGDDLGRTPVIAAAAPPPEQHAFGHTRNTYEQVLYRSRVRQRFG